MKTMELRLDGLLNVLLRTSLPEDNRETHAWCVSVSPERTIIDDENNAYRTIKCGVSSGIRDHKMQDHNMGVARKKFQTQQQQQYKQTGKQTKNIKGLPTTRHSSLLRIF